jgi:hypothetical protein
MLTSSADPERLVGTWLQLRRVLYGCKPSQCWLPTLRATVPLEFEILHVSYGHDVGLL